MVFGVESATVVGIVFLCISVKDYIYIFFYSSLLELS